MKEIKQMMTLLEHLCKWVKINLMLQMKLLLKKNKEIIKGIIDPTPGLFIDEEWKPN